VRVRYRRNGNPKEALATVAQVDGDLLDAVEETRPFGFFHVAVRGCVKARGFRAAALDAAGNIIGRSRPQSLPRARCKPGSAGSILTGGAGADVPEVGHGGWSSSASHSDASRPAPT
jgi:hypothetical protein